MQIGIGTYSFGGIDIFFNLGLSLKEIFEKIASLGFDSVELLESNLQTNSTEDINKWLEETGLKVTSVHAFPTEEIVDKLAAVGGRAVICPGTPFNSEDEAKEVAKKFEAVADYAKKYDIKIGYHNHNHEFYFTEGKTLIEHLLDNSSNIYLQLDCGWVTAAGTYAPNFIRKYKNRIVAIHVKENDRVIGPGQKPASASNPKSNPFEGLDISSMSLQERQAIVDQIKAGMAAGSSLDTTMQCRMGDSGSNINWHEIKAALDEQDFDAFWIVEREHFYDEHDKCLADDCRWLRENIDK